jgi:hypothetical protein
MELEGIKVHPQEMKAFVKLQEIAFHCIFQVQRISYRWLPKPFGPEFGLAAFTVNTHYSRPVPLGRGIHTDIKADTLIRQWREMFGVNASIPPLHVE